MVAVTSSLLILLLSSTFVQPFGATVAQQPHVQVNSSGLVAAVNASSPTPTLPGTIPVGPSPTGMAFDPNNGMLYVASSVECCTPQNSSVTVIDTGSNRVVGNIKVPYATDLAVVESTDLLYISTHGFSDETVVMNAKTNQIQDIVSNLERSRGLAVDESRGIVYMANIFSGNITALSYNGTKHLLRPITVDKGAKLYNIAVNSETGKVYTSTGNNTIFAVDPSTNAVSKITLNYSAPIFVFAVNPITNLVYVAGGSTVSIIDGSTDKVLSQTIQLQQPVGYDLRPYEPRVVVNSLKNLIYVTHESGNFTSVIDGGTNTLISTVKMPDLPSAFAVNPKTGDVYVADYYTNSVSLWNPTLTQMVNLPLVAIVPLRPFQRCCTLSPISFSALNPVDLAFNPKTNRIYVADQDANLVRVIDPEQNLLVANLAVPTPLAIAVVPSSNLVYVISGGGDETYVIDGKTSTVIGHYTNLERSHRLAVDENLGKVYTVGTLSNNITAMWYNGTGLVQKGITIDKGSFFDNPGDIAVNSKTSMVYVSRDRDRLLYAIDPATDGVTKIRLPVDPLNIALNPNTNLVYVSGYCGYCTTILTIDGSTNRMLPQFLDVGAAYGGKIAVNPNTNTLVVTYASYSSANISPGILIINASRNALTDNVILPFPPESIAFNPRTGTMFAGVVGTVGSGAASQRMASVVQVVNRQLTFPNNIIARPLLFFSDLLPEAIGEGNHYGVWYDRVTLQNVGTQEGVFLLETAFIPGVNSSVGIVSSFSGTHLLYGQNGLLVYTASIPPLTQEWVDIPIAISPSVVQFQSGPLQPGQLFQVGDRYHLGETVQLATLTSNEWTALNSTLKGADLIGKTMNVSSADEVAFYNTIRALQTERCGNNQTSLQNCASLISADTRKVAPDLADYIDGLVEGLPNATVAAIVAAPSGEGVGTTGAVLGLTPAIPCVIGVLGPDPAPVPPPASIPKPAVSPACYDGPSDHHISNSEFQTIKSNEGYAGQLPQCSPLQQLPQATSRNCRIDAAKDYGFYNDAGSKTSSGGYCTTGYGHLIGTETCQYIDSLPANNPLRKAKDSLAWIKTETDATKQLRNDIPNYEKPVNDNVNVPLCQAEFDALVDFTFNVGGGSLSPPRGLKGSQILMKLNQGDYDGAAKAFENPLPYAWGGQTQLGDKSARVLADEALFNSCKPGHCTKVVAAVDPNYLYANPVGYTRGNSVLDFTVAFENLKNATAAAQNIKVVVTIDRSLNLSTFAPLAVSHQDRLRNITIDSANRQVTWYFQNISLPPDVTPPQGEGWVRYTIQPNANLASSTSIMSQARVYFDFAPPIATNVVEHIIDDDPPVTRVNPLPAQTSSTSFDIQLNGTDKGSGILSVQIFASMDNASNFQPLNMTGPDTAHFVGEVSHTYYFISIGIDKVGNVEVKSMPDTSTTIVTAQALNLWLILIPSVAVIAIVGGAFYLRSRRKSKPSAAIS